MPKKGKSSIGRKFKKQSKETKLPSRSENKAEEANKSTFDIVNLDDQIDVSCVEESVSEETVQEYPSILPMSQANDSTENDVTNEGRSKQEATIAFENNMETCSKREKQSALAFQRHGIESKYEWPKKNESKDDSYIRKHRNNAKLNAAKQSKFRCIENEEIRSQRRQRHAEEQKRYAATDNEELRTQRHRAHAEAQHRYINTDNEELRTQRHRAHAEAQHRYIDTDNEELRTQRHRAHAETQDRYLNTENETLTKERHENRAQNKRNATEISQIRRSRETPVQRRERMQRELEERHGNRRVNKKGCNALKILKGEEIVQEHHIGALQTATGSYENLCEHCKAIRFPNEKMHCCHDGKVSLAPVPEPTPMLKRLLEGQDRKSNVFRKYIIPMNNALCLASIKIKFKKQVHGSYNPQVIIQGKAYYYIAPLEIEAGNTPKYASLYVHDPSLEGAARKNCLYLPPYVTSSERSILEEILLELQEELRIYNPYIRDFLQICQIPDDEIKEASFVITEKQKPKTAGPRTYTSHHLKEVSVMMQEQIGSRDIIVKKRGGGIQEFKDTNRACDPLHFVLLHSKGHDGWSPDQIQVGEEEDEHEFLDRNDGKRLTCNKFYKYRLQMRHGETNYYLLSGRLFQEYVCLSFAKAEQQKLNYLEMNQKELRSDVYQNIADHMMAADVERLGRSVILPASHIGSPRDMHSQFQDAMAVVRKYGKPDLFITFTCNPAWKEITENLKIGQKAEDRNDLMERVFELKLDALEKEILEDGIFGCRVANLRVIEFQKRGMPHAHILIILQSRHSIRTSQQVDQIVCSEIPPDPESIIDSNSEVQELKRKQAERLRLIVLKNMVHCPCGIEKRNATCMYDSRGEVTEKCQKSFPKQFVKETIRDEKQSYATYQRRSVEDGGIQVEYNNRKIDNGWIVPYSPYLLLRYNCHINVEICASAKATKYLYKYLNKGGDRAMMKINDEGQPLSRNEVREFQDYRHIGASEAIHRIFEFPMRKRYPGVIRLPIHLENQQAVYFHEDVPVEDVLARSDVTELTAFFAYNLKNPNTKVPYISFPEQFVYDKKKKEWKIRKRGTNTLGRIYSIHPSKGELFFLRMLLSDTKVNHSAGKTSYEDLKTVEGVKYDSYQEVCRALGMLKDDELWRLVMEDAKQQQLPKQMRELFVMLMVFSSLNDPFALLKSFWEQMSEDFEHQCKTIDAANTDLQSWMLMIDLQDRLESSGNGHLFARIGVVTEEMQVAVATARRQFSLYDECREIREELEYDREEMQTNLSKALNGLGPQLEGKFTDSQSEAFQYIKDAIDGTSSEKQIYVDARGGTGKTLLKTKVAYLDVLRLTFSYLFYYDQ